MTASHSIIIPPKSKIEIRENDSDYEAPTAPG